MGTSPLPVVTGTLEPDGRLAPGDTFDCERLHATIPVKCCVLRQSANRRGRTADAWRGQAAMFPSCAGCPQGIELQNTMVDAATLVWRGAGPGGRFDRGRPHADGQAAARKRLQLVGALDPVPTCDGPAVAEALVPLDQTPE